VFDEEKKGRGRSSRYWYLLIGFGWEAVMHREPAAEMMVAVLVNHGCGHCGVDDISDQWR
jgi:hypothetical protein